MPAAAKWQEWASFTLGLWLALSPWILDHVPVVAATANAAVVGLLLALGSHLEAALEGNNTADWLNFTAGLWLIGAPWLLDYQGHSVAIANALTVGIVVAALAASALSLDKHIGRWWHRRFAGH